MTLLSVRTLVRLLNTVEPAVDLPDATGVAYDSRQVRPGDAFFALAGATTHGLRYADEALARGAAYVVADRPHRRGILVDDANAALLTLGRAARERLAAPVVAVTGSVGKTSTKAMLAAALGGRATEGNLNTHFALARFLIETACAGADDDAPLVLELGIDRVGEMAELLDLTRPDHAVLTTIGPSHLSALTDLAGVAREKTLLLDRTPGVLVAGAAAAPHLRPETLARTTVVALGQYAAYPGARATVTGAATTRPTGSGLTYSMEGVSGGLELPWPGRGMAENALLALTAATLLGVPAELAGRRLVAARLEHGRLELSALAGITLIDDSYNSNPTSLEAALDVLNAHPRPRVAFLADMRELGALEYGAHLRAGELTRDLDLVVAVGPASAALLETNPAALHATDAAAAAAHLAAVPPGATVLVKGSRSLGMERLVDELRARAASGAWLTRAGAPC